MSHHHRDLVIYNNQQGGIQLLVDGSFDSGVTRAPSDGLFMSVKDVNFSALGDAYFGFFDGSPVALAQVEHAFKSNSGGWRASENGADLTPNFATIATGQNYDIVAVYDADLKAHYFLRAGTNDFRRIWRSNLAVAASTVYGESFNSSATFTNSFERFGYLGTGLLAPAISVASPSVGALTDLPDGDVVIQFTCTARPSSGLITLNFRKQNATNYWQIEITSTGLIRLLEIVNGSATARISAAAAINNGEVVSIVARGNTITLFSNNTQDGTYTSANNFLRNIGFELASLGTGGDIDNLNVWKAYARDESGVGSELVLNGTFDTDLTSWVSVNTPETLEQSSGQMRIVESTGSQGGALQDITVVNGTYYLVTFDYAVLSGTGLVSLQTAFSHTQQFTGTGSFSRYIQSTGTSARLQFTMFTNGEMRIDNVSVKPVTFVDDALGEVLELFF